MAKPLSGYRKMRRALAQSVLTRPHGLVERLVYPIAREAFRIGYANGYGEGHIDGQYLAEQHEYARDDEGYCAVCGNDRDDYRHTDRQNGDQS